MASTLSYTYTGTYSGTSRSITAWIRYTWEPTYSPTQSRLRIHSMGVRNNSGAAMEWGDSSKNGPKYISVTPAGQSQYRIGRTSTSFKWAGGNYDYWNFVTNGRSSAITAWDGSTVATYYFTRGTSNSSVRLIGHIYKKGAWAVNADFATTLTIPAKTYAVSYNANGGTGAPAAQAKTHGVALTLSVTVPTRAGYDFLGWSTDPSATLPTYRYGPAHDVATSFTTDAITTLYAVWHESFVAPQIENLRAYRINDSVTTFNPAVNTTGTRCYADFEYTPPSNHDTVSVSFTFGQTAGIVATSGSYKYGYTTNNHLPTSSFETVTATISGTKYTYTVDGVTYGGDAFSVVMSTTITKALVLWDAYKNDTTEYQAFAFGQPAREQASDVPGTAGVGGNLDVYFDAAFMGDLEIFLDTNAASGVDYDIIQALIALGWYDTESNGGVLSD